MFRSFKSIGIGRFINIKRFNSTKSSMELFFDACRSPIQESVLENFQRHESRISMITLDGGRVEAYVLPKTIPQWPTFAATKQESERCPEMYFKRIADTNIPRFDETVRLLKDRKKVISTGLSGIGKSTEVNGLLMVFLSHLGGQDWPKEVWYRCDNKMVKFSLERGVPTVKTVSAHTLNDVLSLTDPYNGVKDINHLPVLLLELSEDENNPRSYIPTYIPLSNRNVYDITKEMQKSNGQYMLVAPPTCEDIQEMAVVEAKVGVDSLFQGLSEDAIREMVKSRVDILGPKIRDVFVSEGKFNVSKKMLSKQADKLFCEFSEISVDHMPKNARNYIGAFVVNDSFVPSLSEKSGDWYYIDFLSDYIKKVIALACNEGNFKFFMSSSQYQFDYLIAEAIMVHSLMAHKTEDIISLQWKYNNWTFYKNPVKGEFLSHKHSIPLPKIPLCTKEILFSSLYLRANVSELQQGVLYRCSLHNGALYDALVVVGHIVYIFQSSSLSASTHSLDYSTIKNVMDFLKFDSNPQYSMCYVYCSDNSSKSKSRCDVTGTSSLSREELTLFKKTFTINIARVCYYPLKTEFLI